MEALSPDRTVSMVQPEHTGGTLPKITLSNIYPTVNGQWGIIAANRDTVIRRLAAAMRESGLADDEWLSTHVARGGPQAELAEIATQFTARHATTQVIDLLDEHAVHVRIADMLVEPQYRARESIVEVERHAQDSTHAQGAFLRLSRTNSRVRWSGPPLSRHTDGTLHPAGVAADRLPVLREDRVNW